MRGRVIRRGLLLMTVLLIEVFVGILFLVTPDPWAKIMGLEVGVFGAALIAYAAIFFYSRLGRLRAYEWRAAHPLLDRLNGLPLLCMVLEFILFDRHGFLGLPPVSFTSFSVLFFVPTIATLMYVLSLLIVLYRLDRGERANP